MLKNTIKIPVNEPLVSLEAKAYVTKALQTKWISSSGSFVTEFERKFAKYIGVKYGVSVSSGTAALHVALLSLGISEGDEVLVPAFTMASPWSSVLYVNATPVFIDCDNETFNIDPKLIEKKITKKTKAIIIVHIYGHPVNMDPILKIAKKYNLFVIEDAAEAHGATYKNKKCGSFGHVSCFSFYGNKIITCGEGGMLLTNDLNIASNAKKFKDLCHSSQKRFIHDGLGFNYRLTNLQAALGCGELENITKYLKIKRKMATTYDRLLSKIPGVRTPVSKSNVKNVFWMYGIIIDEKTFGINKDALRKILLERGVDTRDFFYPPTDQPYLKKYLSKNDKFPNSEFASKNGLYLPSGLAITQNQIKIVANHLWDIYNTNRK